MSTNSQTMPVSINRLRRIAGDILICLAGFGLLATSGMKFAHVPPVIAHLTSAGFGGEKINFVASVELLSALLFLLPLTRSLGILFVSAFLGGAIATHVQAGEYARVATPALFMALCWLGSLLRYPEVLWSLNRRL
jgi:hypothetical protein